MSNASYIGGRPRSKPEVVKLSSTVDAIVDDNRVTLVREKENFGDAVISLSASAEAALLELLLQRKAARP